MAEHDPEFMFLVLARPPRDEDDEPPVLTIENTLDEAYEMCREMGGALIQKSRRTDRFEQGHRVYEHVEDIFPRASNPRQERLDQNEQQMNETREGLGKLGLRLIRKNEYHYHIVDVDSRRVIAQWWPSSGKTMDGQRRGQVCRTGKQLVAWMRDKREARRG